MAYDYKNRKKRLLFREKRLKECGGLCEVCGKAEFLVVDHNKTTGALRGLLCYRHNSGLGVFRDSPEELEAAATYLRKYGSAIYSFPSEEVKVKEDYRKRYEKSLLELLSTNACKTFTDVAKVHQDRTGCSISAAKTFVSRAAKKHNVTAKRLSYKDLS